MVEEGGNGGGNKIEEVKPHPVMETLSGIQYCINSNPPLLESFLLGFQHCFLALGIITLVSTSIVPLMGGGNHEKATVIQNMLFVAGINTLIQTLIGTRLPVVIGGSHAFITPITTIILTIRYSCTDPFELPHQRFERTMARVQGALVVASIVQLVLGVSGFWRLFVRYLSPLSMVPFITFSGLGLFDLGFTKLADCVELGIPQLLLLLIFSQYISRLMKNTPLCYRCALIFSTAIAWVYAVILTSTGVYSHKPLNTQLSCTTDRAGLLHSAPWVYIPRPFQWGKPTIYLKETIPMVFAGLVALTESTGTFIAAARYASATPVPPSVVSRGTFWLGFGTMLNALWGAAAGPTASVESAGLLGLTRVGSRRVIQISAGFMIIFSIFAKLGAFLASVPSPIMAASYCILYAYVSSAGLNHLQFCNLNSFRTLFILGFSSFMAISVPQYFRDYQLMSNSRPFITRSIWVLGIILGSLVVFRAAVRGRLCLTATPYSSNYNYQSTRYNFKYLRHDSMRVLFISSPLVAVVFGIFLDNTIDCEEAVARNDSGKKWWERFIQFTKDMRNAEFYSLPCKLSNCFPSL